MQSLFPTWFWTHLTQDKLNFPSNSSCRLLIKCRVKQKHVTVRKIPAVFRLRWGEGVWSVSLDTRGDGRFNVAWERKDTSARPSDVYENQRDDKDSLHDEWTLAWTPQQRRVESSRHESHQDKLESKQVLNDRNVFNESNEALTCVCFSGVRRRTAALSAISFWTLTSCTWCPVVRSCTTSWSPPLSEPFRSPSSWPWSCASPGDHIAALLTTAAPETYHTPPLKYFIRWWFQSLPWNVVKTWLWLIRAYDLFYSVCWYGTRNNPKNPTVRC